MKSKRLYQVVLASWFLLCSAAAPTAYGEVHRAFHASILTGVLVAICTLFVAWFWLNGVKDWVYTSWYHLAKARAKLGQTAGPTPAAYGPSAATPTVALVYCTCDDFDPVSLRASMAQDYPTFRTVILDDSRSEGRKRAIDDFAAEHGVEIVRRDNREGFKAGNLNNFLRSSTDDYFVILDSDEIAPPHFIRRCLDYFQADANVGIVQANHVATRNRNRFMRTFAAGVDAHWPAYQSLKQRFGFLSLLGHGAMVSRACFEAAGGFPHVVAEDLCFTIRARGQGYLVAFAEDLVCEEEYPVNYLAFRKRHAKWTQGNMEFIKKFSGEILRSNMNWYEKLDIVLFTYSLPLTCFFVVYLLINLVALPSVGYHIHWSSWLLGPTVLCLVAPMMNDVATYVRRRPRDLPYYCAHSMMLYGSMFFTSLRASAKALVGSPTFLVTPKEDQGIGALFALRCSLPEMAFALALLFVSVELDRSVLPCLLLVGSALSGTYLTLMANDRREGRTGMMTSS